jgi:hypothetical protein
MINKKLGLTIILSILLALLTTSMAFADEDEKLEFEGVIIAIFPDDFRIEIEVDNDGVLETYLVEVGQNFDFDSILVGDTIEVKGILDEDSILIMTELKIKNQEQEKEQEKEQEGELEGYFCENEGKSHPMGLKISANYGVEYSVIEGYLCGENHIPMGQIKLAVQTASIAGTDYTEYLDGFESISWGKIWQELGLKGKPDHGIPFGQLKKQDGETKPGVKVPPGQAKKNK